MMNAAILRFVSVAPALKPVAWKDAVSMHNACPRIIMHNAAVPRAMMAIPEWNADLLKLCDPRCLWNVLAMMIVHRIRFVAMSAV